MADKLMRALVSIPLDSGIPEDAMVNTLYFDGDDSEEDDAAYHSAVMTLLTGFYQAIDNPLFGQNVAPEATVKIYDMRDALPRVPEFVGTIPLSPLGANSLPSEVAVCLSFQADAVSGLSQKRRRGRIYLGPICADTALTVEVVNGQMRPRASVRTVIANAAHDMAVGTPLPILGSVKWAVYSPTTDLTSTLDDAFHDITNGWIDDSFDTQRRRGPAPTTRTLWTD